MSTIAVTNLKHESATGNNIVLASDGTASFAEVLTASKGIKFPATQVSSADANTLDDYEEGTWTPTFISTGANFTYDPSYQSGNYTKIGRLVQVQFYLGITALSGTTSNGITVGGLPFTTINNGDARTASYTVSNMFGVDWPATAKSIAARSGVNVTTIGLIWTEDDGGGFDVTAANIGANGYIAITGIYTAA